MTSPRCWADSSADIAIGETTCELPVTVPMSRQASSNGYANSRRRQRDVECDQCGERCLRQRNSDQQSVTESVRRNNWARAHFPAEFRR